MALGGGTFTAQNKILPGSYINFVSRASAGGSDMERGVAAMGLELSWGPELTVQKISRDTFLEDSRTVFGYPCQHDSLKGLRDLFQNAKTLYAFRLNSGGKKAANTYAEAMYTGTAGNQIAVAVLASADTEEAFEVQTIVGTELVDTQTVKTAAELTDNNFVVWKKAAELAAAASVPLTGGEDGTVSGEAHQAFLDAMEGYAFHAMGTTTTEETVKRLYKAYQIRMREEVGKKFQTVLYQHAADYEGVVNLKNPTTDAGWPTSSLVYYTTGLIAGCDLGASNTNHAYTGEFTVNANDTQYMLKQAIRNGEFVYHKVEDKVCVLVDITSLTTLTEEKGEAFQRNETIRVIDNIAASVSGIFNRKYLGKIPNNPAGRISLQTDILNHHIELERMQAITDLNPADIAVLPGDEKAAVVIQDAVIVTGFMEKLYMTCVIA